MTDYEIKLMRNINKLNNFMEDKSIEYQDLTLELIEEFVLQEFKSSNRASVYNNIKILNAMIHGKVCYKGVTTINIKKKIRLIKNVKYVLSGTTFKILLIGMRIIIMK